MRFVVRAREPRAAREAQERLGAAQIEAAALAGPIAPWRAAPDGEDVLVINVMSESLSLAHDYAQAARQAGQRPLCVLAGLPSHAPPSADELGESLAGAVALDAPPKLLAQQVRAAARAGVAEEERARRIDTARELGLRTPLTHAPRAMKALYIGAPSPAFLSLETAFGAEGGATIAAFTSYCGFDHLHDDEFDAVMLNGATDPQTALSLCAALRRNATLHHMPTLFVAAPGDRASADAAIDRGASAVAIMSEDHAAPLGWLMEAVRRERRRRAAEHDLAHLRDIMGEARTGLMRHDAFETHLARLAADHHASGRRLSLAALRVEIAPGASMPDAEIWRRGMNEIASLVARLIREADCAAQLDADVIALALPATDLAGARKSAQRITAVAECSAFALGEGEAGPLVFEQCVVELAPGESGRALLARARGAYRIESLPA